MCVYCFFIFFFRKRGGIRPGPARHGADPTGPDHVGVDGGVPGDAHHPAADQAEAELVPDLHAHLGGRRAHRTVHHMLVRAQQLVPGHGRDAGVLRQPPVHHIRHMPDEDHRPADALLQAGEPAPPAAHVLRVRAHLDADRLPDRHRRPAPDPALQRLRRGESGEKRMRPPRASAPSRRGSCAYPQTISRS